MDFGLGMTVDRDVVRDILVPKPYLFGKFKQQWQVFGSIGSHQSGIVAFYSQMSQGCCGAPLNLCPSPCSNVRAAHKRVCSKVNYRPKNTC